MKPKLQNITLTRQEWLDALKVPTPYKNKKKYKRNAKHMRKGLDT